MKFNFIVHIGLHKTGSSSIQETLARAVMPNHTYLRWGPDANHSGTFQYAFSSNPSSIYSHIAMARNADEINEVTQEALDQLCLAITECTTPNIIISAEDISTASTESLISFRDFLKPFANSIDIYCYVRPPIATMASAFQQYMKMGTFVEYLHNPEYRARLEHFDQVFGRDSVHHVKFDRKTLKNGDVVLDFADRLGIALEPSAVKVTNEASSLEVVAALYAHQTYGQHKLGYPLAVFVQEALAKLLSNTGSSKLSFSASAFLYPELYSGPDLDWIEHRTGFTISDSPSLAPDAIHRLDGLLDVAAQAEPLIKEAVNTKVRSLPQNKATSALQSFKNIGKKRTPLERLASYLDLAMDVLKEEIQEDHDREDERRIGERKKALSSPKKGLSDTSNFFNLEPEQISAFVESHRSRKDLWFFQNIPMTSGDIICAELSKQALPYRATVPDYADASKSYSEKLEAALNLTIHEATSATGLRSSSGHLIAPTLDRIKKSVPDMQAFSFIRDPAQRIIEEYAYCCSERHPPHKDFRKTYPDLESFVCDPQEQNKQSLFLTGQRNLPVAEALDAIASRFCMIGLSNRLNPSFVLISSMIWQAQALPVPTKVLRTQVISPSLRALLLETNMMDYAIFSAVTKVYDRLAPTIMSSLL